MTHTNKKMRAQAHITSLLRIQIHTGHFLTIQLSFSDWLSSLNVVELQAVRVAEGFRLFSTVSSSKIDTSCASEGL